VESRCRPGGRSQQVCMPRAASSSVSCGTSTACHTKLGYMLLCSKANISVFLLCLALQHCSWCASVVTFSADRHHCMHASAGCCLSLRAASAVRSASRPACWGLSNNGFRRIPCKSKCAPAMHSWSRTCPDLLVLRVGCLCLLPAVACACWQRVVPRYDICCSV
jgi:hypothetical protein